MMSSSMTPLFVPPVRRQFRQPPAEVQAPAQIVHDIPPAIAAAPKRRVDEALARLITEAGQRRRAEIPDRGMEPTLPMARAIIAAAKKARGTEPPAPLPSNPVALAIVLAARKSRGEIDASGERWLADFAGKFEAVRGLL
jgi:hypothetical protein